MSELTRRNPFPGPQPYRAQEQDYFFGREEAVRRLCNRILAYPCTVLFGPSGAGKSSLMQAGVIPELSRTYGVRTVCIDAWLTNHGGPRKEGGALRPLQQLVEKVYSAFGLGPVPTEVSLGQALQAGVRKTRPRSDQPVLLYLDQLEQLFYRGSQQQETRELLVNLEELAQQPLRGLQLVLAIREDYLGIFRDQARGLPLLLEQGFRLGPLKVGQMVQVARRLAKAGQPPQEDWPEEMVRKLMLQVRIAGQAETDEAELQAAFAQIVCRAIWEERASGGAKTLAMDAEPILHRYLEDTLNSLGPLRDAARTLLEDHLVASDGSRTLLTEQEALEALHGKNAQQVLRRLEEAAILLSEEHQGRRYFELGHDWLASQVHERQQQRDRERRRKRTFVVVVSTCVVVTLCVLSFWKFWEQRRALDHSLMGQARELLGRGQAMLASKLLLEVKPREQTPEWDTLAHEALTSNFLEKTFPMPGQAPRTATFHRENNLLLLASRDGVVEVWQLEPAKQLFLMLPEQKEVLASAHFSPGGHQILTATRNGRVRVWPLEGATKPLYELPLREAGITEELTYAEFGQEGERILTATKDGQVHVWSTGPSPKLLYELPRQEAEVTAARFSIPEGQYILTATRDGRVRVYRAEAWPERDFYELPRHEEAITAAEFSPDGERIVTGTRDGTARVWQADGSPQSPLVLKGHKAPLTAVRFSHDGQLILTASRDGTVKVWRADGMGLPLFVLKGHEEAVSSAEFSPDGRHLVTTSWDGTAKVWRTTGPGQPLFSLEAHQGSIPSIDFTREGHRFVTTSRDGTAKVWLAGGSAQPLFTLAQKEGGFTSAAFKPDGQQLATSSWDGTVKVWKADGKKEPLLFELTGPELKRDREPISTLNYSPEGDYLVTGAWDGTVRVWLANEKKEPLFTLKAHEAPVTAASFSRDGQRILTASRDGTVKVWQSDGKAEPLFTLRAHEALVTAASFSRDGQRILTASRDGTVKVWQSDGKAEPLFTIPKQEEAFQAAIFSPDGQYIATASSKGTVKVWRADGPPSPLFVLRAHEERITALAFSQDGGQLLTACWDGTLRGWDLSHLATPPPKKLQEQLKWSNTDCLEPYQRQSYLHEPPRRAERRHEKCEQAYQSGRPQDAPHHARRPTSPR
jgi:WD40 repeat protein